ncbi:MAG: helix-turn-helix transcriptional regulator [Novosphingobium sp.]
MRDAADLILPLLEGLGEEPLWRTFIARLRERLDADYASIVFRPIPVGQPQSRVVHLFSGADWPPLLAAAYRDGAYLEDPLPYFSLSEGRVYRLGELLSAGDPRHEDYRARMLSPSGMNVLRIVRVEERGGISAWLTVSRRAGEFGAGADALLTELVPYLRAAIAAEVAIERERTSATVAGDAIRRLNFGWITLDGEGRILDADSHGASLLDAGAILLRGRGGRLAAREPQVNRDIAEAVRDLAQRPRAIVLSREPWLDMLLVPASLRVGAAGPAPSLVAYVHSDSWSSADRCEQLGQLFDLIPCEARLALALSRGMSIAEAATELGLTIESARTYSKRIYAKTAARGQTDLVRFIHRSVLAIA